MADPILSVEGLSKDYEILQGISRRRVGVKRAVNDVTFDIRRGEILGLVGESGCGKTTIGRCIVRAIPITRGQIRFHPMQSATIDIAGARGRELKRVNQKIRMVFQDPYASLNPRMNVFDIVSRVLVANRLVAGRTETEARVAEALDDVGLDPQYMRRYPHAFSGGQRQRIAIARALVVHPELVIADEPVSALDVSIQAQILNLLKRLREEMNLTYLFVAHNLAVVNHICDRVAVMYLGRLVEIGGTEELFASPRHPYTEALLGAVPIPDPRNRREQTVLPGEIADLLRPPSGCYFHPRCPYAQDVCRSETPPMVDCTSGGESHAAGCHFALDLSLRGVES